MMDVKIELVEGGTMPTKANSSDVAFDCYVREESSVYNASFYALGFKIQIPEGYGGFIFPRSSIITKGLILSNSVGIIDPHYAKELTACFYDKDANSSYKIGERCCQLVILPLPQVNLVEGKVIGDRGGYGSSGN
jgi:dUTP pyrophosphatase